jgi:hypothetical protein
MTEKYKASHKDKVASIEAAIRELVQLPGEVPVDLSAVALIDGYRDTSAFMDAADKFEHHELVTALAFMCSGHLAAIQRLGGHRLWDGYEVPEMPLTLEEAMGR